MRRAMISAAIAVFVSAPRGASAQGPGEYEHVVEEYRIGDANTAIRRLARWPEPAVAESVRYWAAKLRPEQLVAAAMLHSELAAAILGSLPSATNRHLHFARDLLDVMASGKNDRDRADAVTLRWYRFVVSLYTVDTRLDDAERYSRDGLGRFPEDPVLRFHRGVMLEVRARYNLPDPPRATMARGRIPEPTARQTTTLESAAAEYRRALALDAHLAIARLHLGWIHVRLHDDRARADLDAALADARDDGVRYLAYLFLGGLAERQNRLADALQEYQLAHAAGPLHQTPYVASSRIEQALGHADRARSLAREYAELKDIDDDPWWTYQLGALDEEALQWLRAEARRR